MTGARPSIPALLVSSLLLWGAVGRAAGPERPLGEFLRGARSLELLKVVTASEQELVGTVIAAPRGHPPGTQVRFRRLPGTDLPTVGSEVLVACADKFCLWGLSNGRIFEITTPLIGRGRAVVPPGLVWRDAVAQLAAGKRADDLCARLRIRFTDEPGRSESLRARIDAGSGRGQLSGAMFPLGHPPAALLLRDGRLEVTISPEGDAPVLLSGQRPRQAADGCLEATMVPSWPLARSRRALLRALRGSYGRVTIGRGRLSIRDVEGLRPGEFPLQVIFSVHDGLTFKSELLKESAPRQTYSSLSPDLLSFAGQRHGHYLSLACGLRRGSDLAWAIAEKLYAAGGKGLRCPVRWHSINDDGTVVGQVRIVRVPDE